MEVTRRVRALFGAAIISIFSWNVGADVPFPAEFASFLPPQPPDAIDMTATPGAGPRGGGFPLVVRCTGDDGAFTTIQSAIEAAVDGDGVFVYPNDCNEDGRWHENIDFLGKAIVLKGARLIDPSIVAPTIIDGDAAGPVVRFVNGESSFSVIDGFTITNGLGAGTEVGGGIRCIDSAPSIRRCEFRDNVAYRGGGVGVDGGGTIMIDSCRFSGNVATANGIDGSAFYCESPTSPILFDCVFEQHTDVVVAIQRFTPANLGCSSVGGCGLLISCEFLSNDATTLFKGDGATLVDCAFLQNSGVCAEGTRLQIRDSRFESNTNATAIIASTISTVIEGSDFVGNEMVGRIVGRHLFLTDFEVRDCRFVANQANGVLDFSGSGSIEDCEFLDNFTSELTVSVTGHANQTINRCRFERNQSTMATASIVRVIGTDESTSTVRNSRFIDNTTAGIGAGCLEMSGPSQIENCLFVGNALGGFGTAIRSSERVSNCTVVGNRSNLEAGGVIAAEVTNCVVYGNRSVNPFSVHPQVAADSLSYSIVEGASGGVGVLDVDPRFVDFGNWDDLGTPGDETDDVFVPGDYHLLPDSQCIDRGDPAFAPDPGALDLDGDARAQGCRVDIGAYEFAQIEFGIGDVNHDGVVDLNDVPPFVEKTLRPWGLGVCEADVNEDGLVDGRDIGAFVALQVGS